MAYFIGPQLNEEYKDYLRRVLTDGGFYSRPNPKDFQNDVDTILPLNPILYTPANAGKVSKMYSLIPDTGAGDFTVSRNGTATYFDKDGILKTAQADEPRFEFDPLTGEFKGVLVEPEATNSLLRSQDQSGWTSGNRITLGATNLSDPTGGNNAFKMIANTETGTHVFRQNRGISLPIGTQVNCSVFLKASGINRVQFIFIPLNPTQVGSLTINLSTRTIISTGGNVISGSERVDLLPDDWTRYSFGFLSSADSTSFNFEIRLQDDSGSIIFTGNDIDGIEVFGMQCEIGSTNVTSYIPTVASTVTRPADVISIPSYSALFGDRNSRLININGESKIFINEPDFQLPQGHNRFALEKDEFFTESEQTTLTATTVTYGVRDDIKQELNNVVALNPSLALIPGRGEATSLQTLIPNDGTGDFTVSRNGTATYFDKDGLLKTAQADEPRFEFDPLTGEFKGVLVEPSATNLIPNSVFDGGYVPTGYIRRSGSDGSASIVNSIYGNSDGANAILFVCNNQNESISQGAAITANTQYSISIIIENLTGQLEARNFLRFLGPGTGVVTEYLYNSEIILPNSFLPEGTGILTYRFQQNTTEARGFVFGAGNGVAGNVTATLQVSRFQIEIGNNRSSYIPTVASTVTRPADVIDVTVPVGVTEIKETVNGVENTITSIPTTYQLPNGQVSRVIMT